MATLPPNPDFGDTCQVVHPASVNSELGGDDWHSPYVAYHDVCFTTKLYVRGSTPLPPLAPLIFCGQQLTLSECAAVRPHSASRPRTNPACASESRYSESRYSESRYSESRASQSRYSESFASQRVRIKTACLWQAYLWTACLLVLDPRCL